MKISSFKAYKRLFLCVLLASGISCTNQKSESEAEADNDSPDESEVSINDHAEQPDTLSKAEKIEYYINKLPDRDYTETYGHGYTWFTAAEELGSIGKPAIPYLIEQLQSDDEYVVMLSLYALQLASQDSLITEKTDGEYIKLKGTVLTKESNKENIPIVKTWWDKYGHLWD